MSTEPCIGCRKAAPPILLHFDVNRTIVQIDSVQASTVDDGVREGIAELFWGRTSQEGDDSIWTWTGDEPSCSPPQGEGLVTYTDYCKSVIKNKKDRKAAVRDFRLVREEHTKSRMQDMVQKTISRMRIDTGANLSEDKIDKCDEASFISIFASLFTLVAKLQRSQQRFAILFRSFGSDHKKVETEWNSFCEMRHPVFSKLLEDIGPLDGSVDGVPDRRCSSTHTVYRDAEGILLALDVNTTGPENMTWDAWARQDPKPDSDTRDGRRYISEVLKLRTIEGVPALQRWLRDFLDSQATAAFKDDWAWWSFLKESPTAGKPMLLLPGEDSHQFFFDDNVEFSDARIVDCRDVDFDPVPQSFAMGRYYTKANPCEAVLDDDYF